MRLGDKKITSLLLATQGVGIAFVGFFLAAYLAGLPTTAVLHSEPVFKIPLAILGSILIFLVLACAVIAVLQKK